MCRIAQEGYKRGILKSNEGLAYLHCFHPPSDALPIPTSGKTPLPSLKTKKHLGNGKKSGSSKAKLISSSNASSTTSAGVSILEKVRQHIASDSASADYQKMREKAPAIVPGSRALIPDITVPPPLFTEQSSSQLALENIPSQVGSVQTSSKVGSVQTSSKVVDLTGPSHASDMPPSDASASGKPLDEPELGYYPSDDVHAEARRLLDEDFGPYDEETSRAQFKYPRTVTALLKLVETLKSEKEELREKHVSVHKEMEIIVSRLKMMEESQKKAIVSVLENLMKTSFEKGLKSISQQITQGNDEVKNELAIVLAEMAKGRDQGASLLTPRPPPGFGLPARLPSLPSTGNDLGVVLPSTSHDLRGVLNKKRATSPISHPTAGKTSKSCEGVLSSPGKSSSNFPPPTNQTTTNSAVYLQQPSLAPPKPSQSLFLPPGHIIQSGVKPPTLQQTSAGDLGLLSPVNYQPLKPANCQPLKQPVYSGQQQVGGFSAPPPDQSTFTHQELLTSTPPTSSLSGVPGPPVPRVPLPGTTQNGHPISQQGHPQFAAGPTYLRQEFNPHVANSSQFTVMLTFIIY